MQVSEPLCQSCEEEARMWTRQTRTLTTGNKRRDWDVFQLVEVMPSEHANLLSISIVVHETSLRPAYWATTDSVQKQRNEQMNLKMKKCERKRPRVTSQMSLTQRRKRHHSLFVGREKHWAGKMSLHKRWLSQWCGGGGTTKVQCSLKFVELWRLSDVFYLKEAVFIRLTLKTIYICKRKYPVWG